MRNKKFFVIIFCFIIAQSKLNLNENSSFFFKEILRLSKPKTSHFPLLTIYITDSFIERSNYDFIQGYADDTDLIRELMIVETFRDPSQLISRLLVEKNNPVADLVIGLDNLVGYQAIENNLLETFNSSILTNVSQFLFDNFDPNHYIIPYDYSILGFYFDDMRTVFPADFILEKFTFADFSEFGLAENFILEDPFTTTKGLEFLLYTIALYGDPSLNFHGILGLDWRDWWSANYKEFTIAYSWENAYFNWLNDESNQSITLSYATEPYYTYELYNISTDNIFLAHENNQNFGWLHIDGVSLVKKANIGYYACLFIEWLLSPKIQEKILENTWMYPANKYVEINIEGNQTLLDLSSVKFLNEIIGLELHQNYLEYWKTELEELCVDKFDLRVISGFPFSWWSFGAIIYVIAISCGKKIKRGLKNE